MNFHDSLHHLESACQIFLSPQSQAQQAQAETVLLSFRKSHCPSTVDLCKFIIQNSSNELLLWETSQVLRHNLIIQWTGGSPPGAGGDDPELAQFPDTLLNLLFQKSDQFSVSVQRGLGSVISLIVKHLALGNETGSKRLVLVQNLVQGISGSGAAPGQAPSSPNFITICTTVLEALVHEHQYIVNNHDHSFTYDQHFASKKHFENCELLRILEGCLHYLGTVVGVTAPAPTAQFKELQRVLQLTEMIFYWNFTKTNLPRRITAVIEMDPTPPFKPPPSWFGLVSNPGFIDVVFGIHRFVRAVNPQTPETLVITFNLLTQLFSMQGPLICTKEARVGLLSSLLPQFTQLLQIQGLRDEEVLGLSEVIRKIMLFHRTSTLCGLEQSLFHNFLRVVGSFTVSVLKSAVLEESKNRDSIDDRIFRESSTKILEAWMNILTDADEPPKELLIPIAIEVFNTYVQGHLSPGAGGFRPLVPDSEEFDDEIHQGGDRVEFRDQLQALGLFSRFVISHSVPLLTTILEERIHVYKIELERLAGTGTREPSELLIPIYEDLHWLLLIIGHTLCYDGTGEVNLIPGEIVRFSIESAGSPEDSVKVVQNGLALVQPIQTVGSMNPDPIVKLISTILMLSELEKQLMESGNTGLVSPEVTGNVLWTLERWAAVYFCYNGANYASVSDSFKQTFCHHVPQIPSVIQASLFTRIRQDLLKFTAQEETVKDSLRLLHSLVNSERKATLALRNSQLLPLVQLLNSGTGTMSVDLYRGFLTSMVVVGNCSSDDRDAYWTEIFVPIFSRFGHFLQLGSSREKHETATRTEMMFLLHAFTGIAQASDSRVATKLFERISPVLAHLPGILSAYQNYMALIEQCLKFLTEVGRRMLQYLSRADSLKVYEAAMLTVKSYAVHAKNRRSLESKSAVEEDAYSDLVLLMELLLSLLAKDFVDLGPDTTDPENTPEVPVITASEIALEGLGVLLPLMNAELLGYPNLSSKYYKLVTFLSELHADKLLNSVMIGGITESIALGLKASSTENFNYCCEFIASIANHISRNELQATCPPATQYFRPFLQTFLQMILTEELGKDAIASIAFATFGLISAFMEHYDELISQLVGTIGSNNPEKQALLRKHFGELTSNINMLRGGDRRSRTVFRDRLDGFIQAATICIE